MTKTLKACPFCRGAASVQTSVNHGFRVRCGGICRAMTNWWSTEANARIAWDTRIPVENGLAAKSPGPGY